MDPEQVPDELIEYLLWHEICHHMCPVGCQNSAMVLDQRFRPLRRTR
jgi:hypothetical protein